MEPCDLLETRSSLHYASKKKLGFVSAASFQRNWEGPLLVVQKANVFAAPNEIAAVTFFAKNGAALTKSNTFASVTEWQDSGEHGC